MPAMKLTETVPCNRSRYFPAASPSSRSGSMSASRLMPNELDFDLVPGESWREPFASEPCLNLFILNRPPKLVRPLVEDELRALPSVGGVGGVVSLDGLPKLLIVEALSLRPSRRGGAIIGEDRVDGVELLE